MMSLLNRFSNEEKVTIALKVIAIGILVLLVTGCNSIRLGFNSQQITVSNTNVQYPVKTYTTNFQTFKNLNPEDLGLHSTGNWVHCRTHGFHDLNDWTDFSYSPRFCRPSQGFTQAAQWNWNWGGANHWNNNWMWNPRYRFDYFGNNWSHWMGNAHYGYYGNYGYYGYNNWNYVPYRWRRSNMNGRRSNSFRTGTPVRTVRSIRVIRSTNTVVPVNTRPRTIRSSETRVIKPRRTQTVIPPVRTNTNTRPIRTNTRPVRTNTNNRPIRTNTKPVKTNTSTRKNNISN